MGMTTRWSPEGVNEEDRVLINDFSPKYLCHMMTLLTEADQQHINNGTTLVLVSTEGRQRSVLHARLRMAFCSLPHHGK
jgi:enhancer of polycomb-like protein